jgi:hypothetical protein
MEAAGNRRTAQDAASELKASGEQKADQERSAEEAFFAAAGEEIPQEERSAPPEAEIAPEAPEAEEEEEVQYEAPEAEYEDDDETPDEERIRAPERKERGGRLTRRERRQLKTALTALRLDGVPDDVLDSRPAKELIEWGLDRAEDQKERRSRFSFADEPEHDAQTTGEGRSREAAQERTLDLDEPMKAVADQLGISEDEAKKAFVPVFEAVAKAASAANQSEISNLRKAVQENQQAQAQAMVDNNLARLAEIHPDIQKDKALQEELVVRAVANWSQTNPRTGERMYASLDDAFNDAYRVEVGPLRTPREAESELKRRRRKNGVATIPSQSSSARKNGISHADYESAVFDHVMEGGDYESAQKLRKPSAKTVRDAKRRLMP